MLRDAPRASQAAGAIRLGVCNDVSARDNCSERIDCRMHPWRSSVAEHEPVLWTCLFAATNPIHRVRTGSKVRGVEAWRVAYDAREVQIGNCDLKIGNDGFF